MGAGYTWCSSQWLSLVLLFPLAGIGAEPLGQTFGKTLHT